MYVTATYANTPYRYDNDDKYELDSGKEYNKGNEYKFESKGKSSGYKDDDYNAKGAYGYVKEYGKERDYGYENRDKPYKPYDVRRDNYGSYEKDYAYGQDVVYNKQRIYHGEYNGVCDNDGFYYRDSNSFVICSNNNAYVQPCAPGSRNSGIDSYNYGGNYYYRDFCDVNLVDLGYGSRFNKYPWGGE